MICDFNKNKTMKRLAKASPSIITPDSQGGKEIIELLEGMGIDKTCFYYEVILYAYLLGYTAKK